jgi:hypothetical protein
VDLGQPPVEMNSTDVGQPPVEMNSTNVESLKEAEFLSLEVRITTREQERENRAHFCSHVRRGVNVDVK